MSIVNTQQAQAPWIVSYRVIEYRVIDTQDGILSFVRGFTCPGVHFPGLGKKLRRPPRFFCMSIVHGMLIAKCD